MLYEVVLQSRYFDQLAINRWNYVGTGSPAGILPSLALLNAMGFIPDGGVFPSDTIFESMRALQVQATAYIQVTSRAIYDVEDFFENPFIPVVNGLVVGEGMPPFNAYGMKSNRVRQDIGRGYKRLVGVSEGLVTTGGLMSSSAQGSLALLGGYMSDVLTYDDSGNTLSFAPVIVQKERYHPETNPTGWAYRYYASAAVQTEHTAAGILWSGYDQVRSQNSRQYGRGA